MKIIKYIILCFVVVSCSQTDKDVPSNTILSNYILNRTIENGAVIACSASNSLNTNIYTFFYPEEGATNIKIFETKNALVDKLDYTKYNSTLVDSEPFFNGYLGRFTTESLNEHWIIVTYELDGEIKISNPILTKSIAKPTIWDNVVNVDQTEASMPKFTWQDNTTGDNAIYFQVISGVNNSLLSGTYTFEPNFQYYNTQNVVLNITTQTPPQLIVNTEYNFTLMDVSEDNWVNLVIEKSFVNQ